MRNLYRSVIVVASLMALTMSYRTAFAENGVAVITSQGNEARAEISATDIVVGEPVYLKLFFTNREAMMRQGNIQSTMFFPEGNDVNVQIQRPGELPYRYNGATDPGIYTMTEVNLDTSETVRYILPLIYDAKSKNGFLFGEPGEYKVSVRVGFRAMREPDKVFIEIPPTTIRVRAPEGDDAKAFALINNPTAAKAMHQLATGEGQTARAMNDLAQNYPNSKYASLALFVAAASKLVTNEPDNEGSRQLFMKFLDKYPDDIRANDVIFNVMASHHRDKNYRLAQEWYNYLLDRDNRYYLHRYETPLAFFYHFGRAETNAGRRWWMYEEPEGTPFRSLPPDE